MKMPSNQQRELERTRYWQGQMLRSGDFRGQAATDLSLRWWHNRALHNAYGVALGYAIAGDTGTGSLRGVILQPGVAYDVFGRALVLQRKHTVPLPSNVTAFPITLLVRYRETGDYPDRRQTEGVCLSCCREDLDEEQPEFVWTSADPPDPSYGVPLARVKPNSQRLPDLDLGFETILSAPLAGPYLAGGSTIPGATLWKPWKAIARVQALETVVDTSSAGFQRTPCYFASLEGADGLAAAPNMVFTHIAFPRPDRFVFRILCPIGSLVGQIREIAAPPPPPLPKFYVCWLGCEAQAVSHCLQPEVRKSCCS